MKVKALVGGVDPYSIPLISHQIDAIIDYRYRKTIIGAPHIKKENLAVLLVQWVIMLSLYGSCKDDGRRSSHFLSGAISKTVNMPEDVSVEDVGAITYRVMEAWIKGGGKSIEITVAAQPLSMPRKKDPKKQVHLFSQTKIRL